MLYDVESSSLELRARTPAVTGPPERRSPLENPAVGGSVCTALFCGNDMRFSVELNVEGGVGISSSVASIRPIMNHQSTGIGIKQDISYVISRLVFGSSHMRLKRRIQPPLLSCVLRAIRFRTIDGVNVLRGKLQLGYTSDLDYFLPPCIRGQRHRYEGVVILKTHNEKVQVHR